MALDIYAKSAQLLERLANSIYDRDPTVANVIAFSITEIQVVESWIKETIEEIKQDLQKENP